MIRVSVTPTIVFTTAIAPFSVPSPDSDTPKQSQISVDVGSFSSQNELLCQDFERGHRSLSRLESLKGDDACDKCRRSDGVP